MSRTSAALLILLTGCSESASSVIDGLEAREVADDAFGVVAAAENGELVAAVTARDEDGRIIGVTGTVWRSSDSADSVVIQFDNGMPARAVIADHVLFFDNYQGDTVDVVIVAPDGTTEVRNGVKLEESYISDLRNVDAIKSTLTSRKSALFGGRLSLGKAVKTIGLGLGVVACTIVAAKFTIATAGIGTKLAAVGALGCGSVIVKAAQKIFPESTVLKTTGAVIDGALCALGSCDGLALTLLEGQLEHAEDVSDSAVMNSSQLESRWCKPYCDGKSCGSNWCGGACGFCLAFDECRSGRCRMPSSECRPNCSGRECGSDGCGGTCGSCDTGEICTGGNCDAGCTPDCSMKQCGDDGCRGSCGSCTGGTDCRGGTCVDLGSVMCKVCSVDDDCVTDVCCHASATVNAACRPDCRGILCSSDCVPGTFDCNQAYVQCIASLCEVIRR